MLYITWRAKVEKFFKTFVTPFVLDYWATFARIINQRK